MSDASVFVYVFVSCSSTYTVPTIFRSFADPLLDMSNLLDKNTLPYLTYKLLDKNTFNGTICL